jgi:hypothetical protein
MAAVAAVELMEVRATQVEQHLVVVHQVQLHLVVATLMQI